MVVAVELSYFKVKFFFKFEYRLLYVWKLFLGFEEWVVVCDFVRVFVYSLWWVESDCGRKVSLICCIRRKMDEF